MKRLLSRLRGEDGFGIIELSIAMVMLNVGILAIVAAFNSGAVSLSRASRIANATTIADTYLERYRGYRNCQIYVSSVSGDTTYVGDTAYSSTQITPSVPATTSDYAPIPLTCSFSSPLTTSQTAATTSHNAAVVGPDHRTYVVDVYIVPVQVTNGGWQKKVTVVVRDPDTNGALVRQSSTYDPYDAP